MSAVFLISGICYIGSQTVVALFEAGDGVVLYGNFCNSKALVFDRLDSDI